MSSQRHRLVRGLVGNGPRLQILSFIATRGDGEWFRQEDVRLGTGLRQAEVNRVMAALENLNLLITQRQPPHDWPYYRRVPSGIWNAMTALEQAIAEHTARGHGTKAEAPAHP